MRPGKANTVCRNIYVVADNIISSLGSSTSENFSALLRGETGVQLHEAGKISPVPFFGSLFSEDFWQQNKMPGFTRFEQLLILSAKAAIQQSGVSPSEPSTAFIISSTKGNISLLEEKEVSNGLKNEISLSTSAQKVATHLGFTSKPLVISQACISGVVAFITARRLLQAGLYKNVVIVGADLITRFVLSGFQSFQAVSDELCRPFDAGRKGINLGEAAASVVLSDTSPAIPNPIQLTGGAISNDANHISGPSRTGQELFLAISGAMQQAEVSAKQIDFISLHGTATLYNDDMESRAVTLAALNTVPVNSLKGYYGHTLGAAGLLESVISIQSLRENIILPTKGFAQPGTVENINVCSTLQPTPLATCLKTASGFGGCNAAVVWQKTTAVA